MRVVYFGSGPFSIPAFRRLLQSPHECAAVITQPDRRAGRGKKTQPTPLASHALREGIEPIRAEDVNTPEFVDKIRSLNAHLGVVAAFGQMIKAPLREAFPGGCINLHASLLPRYRGAAPIHWAILGGEKKTGVTAFRLVDRMDAGPILVQRETMIRPDETAGELHDRLARVACDAMDATLVILEQNLDFPGEPQDESLASLAPKLFKSDGYLDFREPAERLALKCRAMWPWPGARCLYVGSGDKKEEVTIATAQALTPAVDAPPGTLTEDLCVATSEGALRILAIKPAGKRLMAWEDFVNGRRVMAGNRFESLKS
ncbi:MAG: methionyl-tRNA formyltransferase [Deltaproteobacteria bacterium]|nr:methionyl-tRNA formyltransferase [Deltaproteobacteria bacterium]